MTKEWKKNAQLTAFERACLWITAGLAGLLVAAFLVGEVHAHDREAHGYPPYTPKSQSWPEKVRYLGGGCKYFDGVGENCYGGFHDHQNQHLFNSCVYRLNRSKKKIDAFWKSRPELERELNWIYRTTDLDDWEAVVKAWLYYRCSITDHWKGFVTMKKQLEWLR